MNSAKSDKNIKKLKNTLRGEGAFRHIRHSVIGEVLPLKSKIEGNVTPYLLDRAFRLNNKNWLVLTFDHKDWNDLELIARSNSDILRDNITYLVYCHVSHNLDRISEVRDNLSKINNSLFSGEKSILDNLSEFKQIDSQSVHFFKLIAAAFGHNSGELTENFMRVMRAEWAERRLIYPFAFCAINYVPETNIPNLIEYLLSGNETKWERRLIHYLVGDRQQLQDNIVPFLYASLQMHPYDSAILIADYLNVAFANSVEVERKVLELASRIDSEIYISALRKALSRYGDYKVPINPEPSVDDISLDISVESKKILARLFTVGDGLDDIDRLPDIYQRMAQLKRNRFPSREDYDYVAITSAKWSFLEYGRVIHGFFVAAYMFPRRSWVREKMDLLHLLDFLEGAPPFVLLAPGVLTAPERHSIYTVDFDRIVEDLKVKAPELNRISNRSWIQWLQFWQSLDQNDGRMTSWIDRLFEYGSITRSYICGADWKWLENLLKQRKVSPFVGNARAAYVFLMKGIEQREDDSTTVRSILRQVIRDHSHSEFVEFLIEELGDEATSFIFYFMNTENLLISKLCFNDLEALDVRLRALSHSIFNYGFNDVVDRAVFTDEVNTLTRAICYKRLSPSQFEVPWEKFKSLVLIDGADSYEAYTKVFSGSVKGLKPAGEAMVRTTVVFPNDATESYNLPNYQWSLATIIIYIFQSFIQHPAYGLEVILSTRIRHNVLIREFEKEFDETGQATLRGVLPSVVTDLFERFKLAVVPQLECWVDEYLQSKRPGKSNGMFDIIPNQKDIEMLVSDAERCESHADIVELVVNWISSRLQDSLCAVRGKLAAELLQIGADSIAAEKLLCSNSGSYRQAHIDKVAAASNDVVTRTLNRVVHWFDWPAQTKLGDLTFSELKHAIDGRFEREVQDGRIVARISSDLIGGATVEEDKVRLVFDMLSEIYLNAIKRSGLERTRIRISTFLSSNGSRYLVFSNDVVTPSTDMCETIDGAPSTEQFLMLRSEGETGLNKIAASYSTFSEKDIKAHAIRRKGYFHLILPFNGLSGDH